MEGRWGARRSASTRTTRRQIQASAESASLAVYAVVRGSVRAEAGLTQEEAQRRLEEANTKNILKPDVAFCIPSKSKAVDEWAAD